MIKTADYLVVEITKNLSVCFLLVFSSRQVQLKVVLCRSPILGKDGYIKNMSLIVVVFPKLLKNKDVFIS